MNNNNNNGFREDKPYCYFHPREVVVGVCPLCLNERLLILASTQGLRSSALRSAQKASRNNNNNNNNAKKTPINFHKIFDFGSLLQRLEFRPWKSDFRDHDHDHDYVSTSQEDSFISIKFEENGMASWEKKNKTTKVSKASQENRSKAIMSYGSGIKAQQQQEEPNYYNYKETRTVIEHGKPRASSLRWRKRIGHLFQHIRWKRSNKGAVCHVSNKVEGVKVRKGWIRTLSKKRTME